MTAETTDYYLVYPYNEHGSRAKIVKLITENSTAGKQVVDLGAGAGIIAAPLAKQGFRYYGLEAHPGALRVMTEAGIENQYADLTDLDRLQAILDGLPEVGVFCLLDVIEHLVEPERLLTFLSEYALAHNKSQLVVSVPNVTHQDIGIKLLMGRWDVKESGLLDAEHVRFFTSQTLETLLKSAGWELVARLDYTLSESDQYDADLLTEIPNPTLGAVHQLAAAANPYHKINQFTWLLQPVKLEQPPTSYWQAVRETPHAKPNLASLRETVEQAAQEVAQLRQAHQASQQAVQHLQQEHLSLQQETQHLQQEHQALQADYASQSEWATKLQTEYEQLQKWATELQNQLNASQSSGLKTKLGKQINAVKDKFGK